jgi:branched-chain amino acid transport system substrate-binding protein
MANGRLVRSLIALAAGLALLMGPPAEAQQKGTIKIATQSPLSGGQAVLGEAIKLGTQLAVEQLKGPVEKLGFKVEVVPFDDQAKPDVGVANARNLMADKDILAVVGHLNSGVAIPSSEVYKEDNLVMVSPANTNPVITDRNLPNVNRVCGRDDVQGQVGAEFAKTTLKAKTAYVIHDKTTYGQGVAEYFKTAAEVQKIQILGFEGTEEKANFDPIITPMKAKNPDLIYFGGIYDQGAVFVKQMREKGVKGKFLGPDGMDSSDFAKITGKAGVGSYYTTTAGPATVFPEAKKFIADHKAKFKKDPEPYATEAYDSAAVILKAVEKAINANNGNKPTREQVAKAVRATKGHKGLTGTITFDEKGDRAKAGYFVLVVGSDDPGKWAQNKLIKTLEVTAPGMQKK